MLMSAKKMCVEHLEWRTFLELGDITVNLTKAMPSWSLDSSLGRQKINTTVNILMTIK